MSNASSPDPERRPRQAGTGTGTGSDLNIDETSEYEEVLFVPQSLQALGITRMARENQKFTILYMLETNDGQRDPALLFFNIKPEFKDTLEELQNKAMKHPSLKFKRELIQKTITELSRDEYCRKILTYFDKDRIGEQQQDDDKLPSIGEAKRDNNLIADQQEEAYACSVSDPDYNNDGLPLVRVSTAIRQDDGPKRIYGVIDTVRPLFKLPTAVYFVCENTGCRRQGVRQHYMLNTPIFYMEDLPISFENSGQYEQFLRCPICRNNRIAIPDNRRYANAKIIELRNPNTGTISLNSVNSTLNMEQLTVIVFNKHTLSIGLGEEVEIVGRMHVLPSSMAFARFGGNSRGGNIRSFGDSGKAQPVLYAKRMRYTKRQQQLELTDTDRTIIQRLAGISPINTKTNTDTDKPKPKPKPKPKSKSESKAATKVKSLPIKVTTNKKTDKKPKKHMPSELLTQKSYSYFCAPCYLKSKQSQQQQEQDQRHSSEVVIVDGCRRLKRHNVVDILAKQLAPRIYDKTGGIAKIATLLTLVGAAPKHEGANYYGERYWINTILAGDKGCGKTTLMEEAVNQRIGSQLVSAQQSTGKGAVAIVERESGSGTAILRVGPAALANGSVCGIDEFQLFDFESQDQFLALQQSGCIYFNKLGIHQLIQAHTNFIATVNPATGSWKNTRNISLGEVAIKEQLWDRQDYFVIFKADETDEQRQQYSEKKIQLSRLRLRPGHSLLKKYIHYVNTDPRLQETKFSDFLQVNKLTLFWNKMSGEYGEIMGNRSFETVFRTASAVARTMQKVEVDSEVADFTIDFLGRMYAQLKGNENKVKFVDPATTTYDLMCKIIKEYSQKQYWANQQQQQTEAKQPDITFDDVAEIASKNPAVRQYMGDKYRSKDNRAVRNLRRLFREKQNEDYDGGKIIVTSKSDHVQMTLRWVRNEEE